LQPTYSMGNRCARRDRAPGFTLIEVLISLVILATLVTLVYGAFNATAQSARRMETEEEGYRVVRWGFHHIMRDLSMAYAHPSGNAAAAFAGTDQSRWHAEGEYPDDAVRFVALSHERILPNAPESERHEVGYALQKDVLVRKTVRSNGASQSDEIGDGVLGLNFRYLKSDIWQDEWDAEEKRLPDLVEVEVILRDAGQTPRRFKTAVRIPMAKR